MVNVCGYKLATDWQKFHENLSSLSENIAEVSWGAAFLTQPVHIWFETSNFVYIK